MQPGAVSLKIDAKENIFFNSIIIMQKAKREDYNRLKTFFAARLLIFLVFYKEQARTAACLLKHLGPILNGYAT